MELRVNMLFDGRYRLLSPIGEGASAQVWKAADVQADGLVVALKIYCGAGDVGTYGWQNFVREFTSVYNLIHTNLLPPTAYNRCKEDGVPYLVLQYCDNGSASSMTGRIDEETLLRLLHDVSAGLAYLHERDIVHQDIKPDNILLDEQCNFLVTDFGISAVGSLGVSASGSRAYMAPERFPDSDGGEAVVIKASDIWSLGATAYELMTGELPFGEFGGLMQKSGEQLSVGGDGDSAGRKGGWKVKSGEEFQPEVCALVASCLSADPWERPKAKEIQQRIESYWANGNWRGKQVNRMRRYWVAAACVAALALAFFVVDFNRTKVRYYKDYVEAWGVPQGVGRVGLLSRSHTHRLYRFEYRQGKLRRMSHVNGRGNLIEDIESERSDRPVDMRLYYTAGGKLSKAKVYSRSGRVEYVRSYNEKLNNITFRYDDEYETEKRLGAQTVGYAHPLQDFAPRGQISHYLISYDRNGYVDTIRYANMSNHRCCDLDGVYGRVYRRDGKGRVVEEGYLGYDNKPKGTSWGLGRKLFTYDGKNNLVRVEYLTVDGKPALDAKDGICIYELDYDKYGNQVEGRHMDAKGELMIPKMSGMGFSVVCNSYDKKGNLVKMDNLGMDRKPIMVEGYASSAVLAYDKNGYLSVKSYRDPDGNRCNCRQNYSIVRFENDEHGNVLECWFYDVDSVLTISSDGFAGYKTTYDSTGNPVERVYYGTDLQPIQTQNGMYGWRQEFDERGMRTRLTYLGKQLQPAMSDENIAVVKYEYDDHANEVRRSFYDPSGERLTASSGNISGWRSSYDDFGNETERVYYNENDEKSLCQAGYASVKYTYDEHGNMLTVRYYDIKERLVLVDGVAGNDYQYDERGNLVRETPLGTDGKQAYGKLAIAYTYDNNDNVSELALFDRNGRRASNYLGFHRRVSVYDSRNTPVETRYYGVNGKLTCYGGDRYAIQRDKVDDRGFPVETRFYGTDERPVCCKEGWASSRREFDAMGNVLRQLFFGLDERPTDVNKMVPEGFCKYDAQGRLVYIAAADGYGHIIVDPNSGWAVMEMQYDRRGNLTEQAYYDALHRLVVVKGERYCKIVNLYDSKGLRVEHQYHNLEGCYEKEVTRYNEKGREVEWRRCYGNGTLKPYDNGAARYTVSYESNGLTPTVKRVYDIFGNMLFYARYNARTQRWGSFQY